MRGLFFKVFAIFWIAQSLIFVISTALIVRRHFTSPEILFDTLKGSLNTEASEATSAFETGGCDALRKFGNTLSHPVVLQDASGRNVCGTTAVQSLPGNASPMEHITGRQAGQQYIWSVPVTSATGRQYFLLVLQPHAPERHNWYKDLLHFAFPQLPVAIVIGGATTFVLVLLFTRPVIRLRKAARELAMGNLAARVAWSGSQSRTFSGDELQALIQDFNHMAERLQSLVGAQQLLLRDVSHELRSPLARLNVALELAREDADPKMVAYLDRIERETEKLNQLISQLLTLSSMEAVEKVTNFEPVLLNRLLEEMIPDAEYEARQRQCSVLFAAGDECVVQGNRELLHRAIENVVRNAIRYTDSGSAVEIRLAATDSHTGRAAILEVSDQGPGIPEEEINAIFRPFYRVDRARSSETGGFGVGLAIAERAVKLHEGELHVLNRAGGGTTIRICFPLIENGAVAMQERRLTTPL
jgi:two-component system sensor histidine kinase CpxA